MVALGVMHTPLQFGRVLQPWKPTCRLSLGSWCSMAPSLLPFSTTYSSAARGRQSSEADCAGLGAMNSGFEEG
jgi:hypothetical protein